MNAGRPPAPIGALLAACVMCAASSAMADAVAEENRPDLTPIRYTEDWSQFTPDPQTASATDRLTRIPIGSGEDSFVSIGGELKGQYEYRNKAEWGAAEHPVEGYLLTRLRAHTDVQLGPYLRFYGELINGLSHGEKGSPPGTNEDRLDVLNLFTQVSVPMGSDGSFTLRAGRQQLSFGLDRLVSKREGTNVPRTFDAVRGIAKQGNWRLDGFLARPVNTKRGVFDDGPNQNAALWGAYATRQNTLPGNGALDTYYLGLRDDRAAYDSGEGKELRHTLGVRLHGGAAGWDYDWEALGQFGSFEDRTFRAYSLATITGYRFGDVAWKPRFGVEAAYASGDRDPNDKTLGTFNPLFPRGDYFSELALLGPSNFYNIRPIVSIVPTEKLKLSADVNFFWRASLNDGIYSPPRSLLRGSDGSRERFVALNTTFVAEWSVNPNLSVRFGYTQSFPGAFIKDTGAGKPIDFFLLKVGYLF